MAENRTIVTGCGAHDGTNERAQLSVHTSAGYGTDYTGCTG